MIAGTPFSTPQEVDLQFDLINHNSDSLPFYDFCMRHSVKAREHLSCVEDIRIGARDEERLDVFPADTPGAPIMVFVHGGWWRGGTRKLWSFVAKGFNAHGFTVVISDYTLTPKVYVQDITQATRAAIAWAYEHAEKINGDRDRLFVSGHSAGGQQAGMVAVTDWTKYGLPANAVRGVMPMSGVFDMRVMQFSWLQPFLQLTGDTAMTESAQFQIPDVAPPCLTMVGAEESEEFHRQAHEFADAYAARGHRSEFWAAPNEDHATYVYAMHDPESPTIRRMVEFCASC